MATKEIILDGVSTTLGADAENVDYTNAGMTGVTNAKGALDNLHDRVGEIEHPDTDIVYTEDNCTIIGNYVSTNGGLLGNGNYNASDFIPIPVGVKMYIKVNYALTYGILFFNKKKTDDENYSWLSGKNYTSNEAIADYTEVAIPDGAIAFRFSHNKSSVNNHISIKFVIKQTNESVVKLKVGAWNIGHFAEGSATTSSITDDDVDEKRAAYRKVFDEVNADILCLSEYEPGFNSDDETSLTKDEILCNYPYYKIGGKSSYNCNAVFSRFPILQTQELAFPIKSQIRYIKEVTLKLNGKYIKVVATHLDFDSNYVDQLEELIARYANDPYVIIGADFNIHINDTWGDYVDGSGTDGYKNYQYLTDAGYTLLRFDYLDHESLVNPLSTSTADNIAVKGFAMGNREFIYEQGVSEGLSDHCMVACELVML